MAYEAAIDRLSSCCDLTHWNLFVSDSGGDAGVSTDLVTSYLSFCCDMHDAPNKKHYQSVPQWKAMVQL